MKALSRQSSGLPAFSLSPSSIFFPAQCKLSRSLMPGRPRFYRDWIEQRTLLRKLFDHDIVLSRITLSEIALNRFEMRATPFAVEQAQMQIKVLNRGSDPLLNHWWVPEDSEERLALIQVRDDHAD